MQNSKTVQHLKQNIYQFSAAKTYQQLAEYNSFLVDENGKERSFSDFKKLVLDKHPTYNKNYLEAEYQTAKASGQMAAKWEGFQRNKERYPYLRYKTVGDEHVRDDHRTLDGFTAHIDDKIWDRIYPPNDWRCRCYVVQTNQKPTDGTVPKLDFMKPEFSVNVGKTGVVFNEEAHPYYVMPKKDKKQLQIAFESMKTRLSFGRAVYTASNAKKVYIHPFADAETVYDSFQAAKAIASKTNRNVKLLPVIDPAIITTAKNNSYVIRTKLADRVTPKGLKLQKDFTTAAEKGSSILVVDLLNNSNPFAVVKAEISKLLQTGNETIKEVILISQDRKTVESIKRVKNEPNK